MDRIPATMENFSSAHTYMSVTVGRAAAGLAGCWMSESDPILAMSTNSRSKIHFTSFVDRMPD